MKTFWEVATEEDPSLRTCIKLLQSHEIMCMQDGEYHEKGHRSTATELKDTHSLFWMQQVPRLRMDTTPASYVPLRVPSFSSAVPTSFPKREERRQKTPRGKHKLNHDRTIAFRRATLVAYRWHFLTILWAALTVVSARQGDRTTNPAG